MADAKILPNAGSVEAFLASVEPPAKREDARALDALFRRVTGEEPVMWGASLIGYGEYETVYASGRAVRWMRSGFSPRKAKHSLHLMAGYSDPEAARERAAILERLGKHSEGKSCLYVNKLADVDMAVLEELIAADWRAMQRIYPPA
ncbi:DUF1801 domain-containing protein [Erythrobacter sp.]|uniref:DUF1801 domain-containing protein n=1 Tax=Erythrobacter sp. TaxID=1042 RepID=UPI001425D20F|nr:DUF1801 domain-containing protein [Erythrobacter sp.]QIQ88070.1 MAG: DUF1801 domain-containing protein [Erythrobacter sp.]